MSTRPEYTVGNYLVDRLQSEKHLSSRIFTLERSTGTFDRPDRTVAIDPDNESVTELTCLCEQVDVARMYQVEATVCKYDSSH